MSAKTKIVVLHMKKLVAGGVLALFVLLLIILIFTSAGSGDSGETTEDESAETMAYVPGVYTASVTLGDMNAEIQVTVDENHINAIDLVTLDESVLTMYPLVSPALEELSTQIIENQSVEGITYRSENQYTSLVLYNAILTALKKASPD